MEVRANILESKNVDLKEDTDEMVFSPRVSVQRYNAVFQILNKSEPPVRKVVDFGCNRCTFFRTLKMIPSIEEIAGVDIDLSTLETSTMAVRPFTFDYLIKRPYPLTMHLFHGSAAEFDIRLADYDTVVGIEIIEHLEASILEGFVKVVFQNIKPQLVILTTPNADFNVCFKNFTGKRNWDHKFEWTRLEFQTWCKNIENNYSDYTVRFEGIGEGPPNTKQYGCCSQMCIFRRLSDIPVEKHYDYSLTPYHLVCEAEHPHLLETRNSKQQLLDEVIYYLNILSHEYNKSLEDEDYVCVPLCSLMAFPKMQELCSSTDDLRKILIENYPLTEDGSAVKYYLSRKTDDSSDDEVLLEDQEIQRNLELISNNPDKNENWDS